MASTSRRETSCALSSSRLAFDAAFSSSLGVFGALADELLRIGLDPAVGPHASVEASDAHIEPLERAVQSRCVLLS